MTNQSTAVTDDATATATANDGDYDSAEVVDDADAVDTDARPSRGHRIGIAVAALLLAAVVGVATGLLIATPRHPGDSSAEAGFARDMQIHHAQAVQMAMIVYGRTDSAAVRQMAYDIALTQQAQIGIMRTWLDEWGLSPTSTEPAMAWMPDGHDALLPDGRMPGMASAEDIEKLKTLPVREADILFCRLMISHHVAGIHMADGVLGETDRTEVRELAEAMKSGQQGDINALRQILTSFGAGL